MRKLLKFVGMFALVVNMLVAPFAVTTVRADDPQPVIIYSESQLPADAVFQYTSYTNTGGVDHYYSPSQQVEIQLIWGTMTAVVFIPAQDCNPQAVGQELRQGLRSAVG